MQQIHTQLSQTLGLLNSVTTANQINDQAPERRTIKIHHETRATSDRQRRPAFYFPNNNCCISSASAVYNRGGTDSEESETL